MTNLRYEDFVMEDKEIGRVVDLYMDNMEDTEITDLVVKICEESEAEEPGVLRNAVPIVKLQYIAQEMSKRGFATGLYIANKSNEEFFKRYLEGVA